LPADRFVAGRVSLEERHVAFDVGEQDPVIEPHTAALGDNRLHGLLRLAGKDIGPGPLLRGNERLQRYLVLFDRVLAQAR